MLGPFDAPTGGQSQDAMVKCAVFNQVLLCNKFNINLGSVKIVRLQNKFDFRLFLKVKKIKM